MDTEKKSIKRNIFPSQYNTIAKLMTLRPPRTFTTSKLDDSGHPNLFTQKTTEDKSDERNHARKW